LPRLVRYMFAPQPAQLHPPDAGFQRFTIYTYASRVIGSGHLPSMGPFMFLQMPNAW
jgi:hypothetical protein